VGSVDNEVRAKRLQASLIGLQPVTRELMPLLDNKLLCPFRKEPAIYVNKIDLHEERFSCDAE
jgi:hypothetical protein